MSDAPRPPEDPDTPDPGVAGDAGPSSAFDSAFEGEAWDIRSRRVRGSGSGESSRTGGSSRSGGSRRSGGSSSGRSRRSSSRQRGSSGREPAAGPGSTDSTRSRRRRGSRRGRHVRAVVVHLLLGLLGLAAAWIVVTGLLAAWQLSQARSDLVSLRSSLSSGSTSIDDTADSLASHAHHAAVLTRGPAWATISAIPYVGEPFETVRAITTETSRIADGATPGLIAAASQINPRTIVQNGSVDLTAVSKAAGPVHTAAVDVAAANRRVQQLSTSTWLPVVDSARVKLGGQLTDLDTTLSNTDSALQVLPTMLGGDGRPRRYFVAFQNNAELRGTGGLPGAFAIVTATNGTIAFERFESDSALSGVASGLDFGAAYDAHYAGDNPYTEYLDSNVSPNFPYAAQIWTAMWRNVSGEQVDGALTVDPGALSYLLAVTGPTTGPDGTQITADNVVALTQKDAYASFPDAGENQARREYLLDLAEAVEKRVVSGLGQGGTRLLDALGKGVSERRILAWSSDPTAQAVLGRSAIGGVIPQTDQPFSMLSLNNGAAGKLDYYLGRAVKVERTGCGDTRQVTVTIALTNNAPASGLPPYVTDRLDNAKFPTVPGQNRVVVDYIATNGAQLLGATLDGQTDGAGTLDEEGHPVFRTILELTPGQTRTWTLTLQEPAGTAPVTVQKQPGVEPISVDVDDRSCR